MEEEKKFSLDEPVEKKNTAVLLDKMSLFNVDKSFVIEDVVMGQWGKLQITLYSEEDNESYSLDINNKLHNFLMEKYGNVPKKWIGNTLVLTSEKTTFKDRKTGENRSGFSILVVEEDENDSRNPSDNDENGEELAL